MTLYVGEDGRVKTLGDRSDSLMHWKYVKKIPIGKDFRYFYTWDEYKAYLADPMAELEKTGQRAANHLEKTGRTASQEIKKAGRKANKEFKKAKRSSENYIRKGRNAANNIAKNADRSKMTISSIKTINGNRTQEIKKKMNELAKKASEKWKQGAEAAKKSIDKGSKWIKDKVTSPGRKLKEWNEERKRKKEEEKRKEDERYNQKAEKVAKKYKYLKRIKVDGRYYYFYTQDEIDNYNKVKDYQANEPAFMKKVKESEVPYTEQENSIMVNPNFDLNDYDQRWEYNCAECTAIYELRMRGYDVESNGLSSAFDSSVADYNLVGRFDLFYEGANVQKPQPTETDEETYQAIKKEIEKNPPGSRGDLSVTWKDGGGHSVAWERDLDGEIHIIDTQFSGHGGQAEYDLKALCRNVDNSSKTCKLYESYGEPATYVTRTDNLKLKPEIQNIYTETKDRKRKEPNTQSTFTVDWDKVADGYAMPEHVMPTRSMTQEEIETKYYHLTHK